MAWRTSWGPSLEAMLGWVVVMLRLRGREILELKPQSNARRMVASFGPINDMRLSVNPIHAIVGTGSYALPYIIWWFIQR
jgi:hypothetical protein